MCPPRLQGPPGALSQAAGLSGPTLCRSAGGVQPGGLCPQGTLAGTGDTFNDHNRGTFYWHLAHGTEATTLLSALQRPGQWASSQGLVVFQDQMHPSCLTHHSTRGWVAKSPPAGLPPVYTWAPTAHGQCPGQLAGRPLPAPAPATVPLDPRDPGRLRERPPRLDGPGPAWWFHSFPHLSTPPRNTTSLHGPMLVHLRNKTQKQIKWQLLCKQERGPASGVLGQRPSVPTPGGHSPVGAGGIKAGLHVVCTSSDFRI